MRRKQVAFSASLISLALRRKSTGNLRHTEGQEHSHLKAEVAQCPALIRLPRQYCRARSRKARGFVDATGASFARVLDAHTPVAAVGVTPLRMPLSAPLRIVRIQSEHQV